MSFIQDLDDQLLTLEEICGEECSNDISPAQIKLTPLCNPEVKPYIIDCSQQLTGSNLTLTQNFQERSTQCSTSPAGYVPSGKMGMFTISLAEGNVDSRLLEIVMDSQWLSESPYEEDEGAPILAGLNEPGRCSTLFRAEICPAGGRRNLVFPAAQLYTETIEVAFNNTDQRELQLTLYARQDPRTGIIHYWVPRDPDSFRLEDSIFAID